MIYFKKFADSIIRKGEGEWRGEKVGHRSNHGLAKLLYTFKGKVERRIVVRASRFFFNFWKERKKLVEETAISRWSAIVVGSWDPHPRDVIQGVGN